jgi:hypothetical protein
MKVETLIVSFLELNKQVSLESIGHFSFDGRLKEVSEEDENIFPFAEDSVTFVSDKNEKSDPNLIDFIVNESGKIRPLATSDLESFSMLGKQFLNIGKPMIIRGLGYLINNQDGTYSFFQGEYIPEKSDPNPIKNKYKSAEKKGENDNTRIDFSAKKKSGNNTKKWIPILILVVLLALAGSVVYYFLQKDESLVEVTETKPTAPQKPEIKSTADTQKTIVNVDTTAVLPVKDSIPTINQNEFLVVVRTYSDLESAQRGYSRLVVLPFAKQIKLMTSDSVKYRIALPVKGNLSDSARLRDSVKTIFGKSAYVETLR